MRILLLKIPLLLLICSCQESFEPDTTVENQQYVVEGYVHAGPEAERSYVIVSRSLPFLDEVSQETFNGMFVKNADVSVNDGDKTVSFTQLCISQILSLPPELIAQIEDVLGFEIVDSTFDICVYVDVQDLLEREVGRTYQLEVVIDDLVLNAVTTIPDYVPLEDIEFRDVPGEPIDSLQRLYCHIQDPIDVKNFYRYKVQVNDRPLINPFFSVAHDAFFDGQLFEFPLDKGFEDGVDDDLSLSLYYTRGDSLKLKWYTLDEAHFDFWNTLEFNRANQGPLSSYTRVAGNVEGALGVWGGYATDTYYLEVPK